jgi:hypothetical protein
MTIENGTQETEFDVDAAHDAAFSNEAPQERPISAPPAEDKHAPDNNPRHQEYEFTANGKLIKAPIDQITKYASQGYDYAQKMAAFNKQQEELKTREEWAKSIEQKYKPVDEYFAKNPDYWNHVESTWKQRQQALDANGNPIAAELLGVKKTLEELTNFKKELTDKELSQKREADDKQLSEDIRAIRNQYPHLAWDTRNEAGQSLEEQVIRHAIDSNIKSFRAAFRDYTFDQHLKRGEERGMQKRDQDIQKRTKLGLLGETRAPTKGIAAARDIKSKSYEALYQEALEELGSGA